MFSAFLFINSKWESETERLKRHMSIPPKRKLELLYELSRFTKKYAINTSPKLTKRVKEARSRYRK